MPGEETPSPPSRRLWRCLALELQLRHLAAFQVREGIAMKGTVDLVDAVLMVREAIARLGLGSAPGVALSQPERLLAPRPDGARAHELDDIPSVIRAMLAGYDEAC